MTNLKILSYFNNNKINKNLYYKKIVHRSKYNKKIKHHNNKKLNLKKN